MTGVFIQESRSVFGNRDTENTHREEVYKTMEIEIGMMWLKAKEDQEFPPTTEPRKRQGKSLPWSLQREHSPVDSLISDFWTPELRGDKFLLF